MPRTGRSAPGGIVFHVLNRGNGRMRLFHNDDDYAAFLEMRIIRNVPFSVPVGSAVIEKVAEIRGQKSEIRRGIASLLTYAELIFERSLRRLASLL